MVETFEDVRALGPRAVRADFPASTGARSTPTGAYPRRSSGRSPKPGSRAALIPRRIRRQRPRARGGGGHPGGDAESGCSGAAVAAAARPDVHDGNGAPARLGRAEARCCRRSPRASCGCRRSASPSRPAAPTPAASAPPPRANGDAYVVNGQKVWTSRVEHSDLMLLLARTTPREQAARPHEGMSVFLVDIREARAAGGCRSGRSARSINHHSCEVFFDDLRCRRRR